MNLSGFLTSLPGTYIVQSFFHALIAALIIDSSLTVWEIRNPLVRQRFRLIAVLFPIFSFPLYQLMLPGRSSISFRVSALFDSSRWLNLEAWGMLPLSMLFLLIIGITILIFLFQEMIPIIRHIHESRERDLRFEKGEKHPAVSEAMRLLPAGSPEILVIEEDDTVIFSTSGRKPAIILSTGLLEALNPEELRVAIAHEIAHAQRNKRPFLVGVFFLRTLMFFNPVVLLEFRRAVQEEEKICDDIAVALTGNAQALAVCLRKLYDEDGQSGGSERTESPESKKDTLEEYSHRVQLGERITRLEENASVDTGNRWIPFFLTLCSVLAVNCFVV